MGLTYRCMARWPMSCPRRPWPPPRKPIQWRSSRSAKGYKEFQNGGSCETQGSALDCLCSQSGCAIQMKRLTVGGVSMRLETARLVIRSFEAHDVDHWLALVNDPEVGRFTPPSPPAT